MDKTYKPETIENHWYRHWEAAGYFAPDTHGEPYCILLPPPNITGKLHMGHAFQQTLMDILIRYHRMCGRSTLWQGGSDHAGIATQMVVERQLESQGTSRVEMGRYGFTKAIWDWKQQSGGAISDQLRRLGASLDWTRECFTLDPGPSAAVNKVFTALHGEGLIYRGTRLVNWDPKLGTALSDLEVNATEEDTSMWHIAYPTGEGSEQLVVATTRPETLLGDVAVAVHPDDERYHRFIGKTVQLPLCRRAIPVIADPAVDPQFGTGCVKITPAHDFNDYKIGRRHDLPLINILTAEAKISAGAPETYRGLDRYEARRRVVADLEKQGLLLRIEAHRHKVPRGDRSNSVIEPWLTKQWYVRAAPLAEPALRAVEQGKVRFIPENWTHIYYEWMRNIEDWCISRQLWWGHQIPAWYDDQGHYYIAEDEATARGKYALDASIPLRQDEDVLDTWFSSALWPLSTLGWPQDTEELARHYPSAVLVTGFDIIFFWVARMIMMGLKFTGEVPFREVYIHGLVRDAAGQKMSKSKGNVLDPIDLVEGIDLETLVTKRTGGLMQPQQAPAIDQATRQQFPHGIDAYGADSLRFTFASLASHGRDIRFDVQRIQGYRNFCNKLWNAARYVLTNQKQDSAVHNSQTYSSSPNLADRWIYDRLAALIDESDTQLARYRFDLAARALYEFTWNEYCDWYLELCKPLLRDDSCPPVHQYAARDTMTRVLEQLLRLLHPFIPFVTEELWQHTAAALQIDGNSIMLQTWPRSKPLARDPQATREITWVKDFIAGVRQIRSSRNIPPRKPLCVQVKDGSAEEQHWLTNNIDAIKQLGQISAIQRTDTAQHSVATVVGETTMLVQLAELIDRDREIERLHRILETLQKEQGAVQKKLDNKQFVQRAPKDIVEKTRQRLRDIIASSEKFDAQYRQIKAMEQ